MRFYAEIVDRPGRFDQNDDAPGAMNESQSSMATILLASLDVAVPFQVDAIRRWSPERRIAAARKAWHRVTGSGQIDDPKPPDRSKGACAGDVALLHPPAKDKDAIAAAKAVCAGCPQTVARPCRTYGLAVLADGVWGGLTRAERAKKRPDVYDVWSGGPGMMFGAEHAADEFNALALVLAAFAYQPGGVTFATRHWCTDHTQCRYADDMSSRMAA